MSQSYINIPSLPVLSLIISRACGISHFTTMPSLPHSSLSFFRSLLIFDAKMRKNIRVCKTRVGAKKSRETTVKILFSFIWFFILLYFSVPLPLSLLFSTSLSSSLILFSNYLHFSLFPISFFLLLFLFYSPLYFIFILLLSFVLLIYHYLSAFLPSCSDEDGTGKAFLHISWDL